MDDTRSGTNTGNDPSTLDETPVPATQSLVKLYEAKQGAKATAANTESVRYVRKQPVQAVAPKPVRPRALPSNTKDVLSASLPKALGLATSTAPSKASNTASKDSSQSSSIAKPTISRTGTDPTVSKPVVPPPRRSQQTASRNQERLEMNAQNNPNLQRSSSDLQESPRTSPPTSSRKISGPAGSSQPSTEALTDHAGVTRKPILPPRPPIQQPSPPRSFHEMNIYQNPRSGLSVDNLANAMVASSLASSRAPSPAKPMPPPPRRKTSRSHLFHHHNSNASSSNNHFGSAGSGSSSPFKETHGDRTPSPVKALRQTLRDPPKPEPTLAEQQHHHHGKKNKWGRHPHKHHEGDRKRYRMALTEQERKRYEGVWAANRGLLLPPPSPDPEGKVGVEYYGGVRQEVLNIVVRDIWRRSKLPDRELEGIWNLVDQGEGTDRLGREQFVVGMWLIDQRLRGNKLPTKVPESVWSSVRVLSGIKIRR